MTALSLIKSSDAPESTINSLSSWLIPVRETAQENLFFQERILMFLVFLFGISFFRLLSSCFTIHWKENGILVFSLFPCLSESCMKLRESLGDIGLSSCCSLKRAVVVIPANRVFQSSITGRFSFLNCILQVQGHGRVSILRVVEVFFVQLSRYIFLGNFCHGEKCFVPFGVEALHVVILQLGTQ